MAVGATLPKTWIPQLRVSSLLGARWRPALAAAIKFPGNERFYERENREGNDTVTTLVPPARCAEQSLGTSARDKSRELRRAANFSTPDESDFSRGSHPHGEILPPSFNPYLLNLQVGGWRINGGRRLGNLDDPSYSLDPCFRGCAARWASLSGSSFVEHHLLFVGR